MASWWTFRSKNGCYKQKMERGFRNGVWTTYAVSGQYPCGSAILSGPPRLPISGKPVNTKGIIFNGDYTLEIRQAGKEPVAKEPVGAKILDLTATTDRTKVGYTTATNSGEDLDEIRLKNVLSVDIIQDNSKAGYDVQIRRIPPVKKTRPDQIIEHGSELESGFAFKE